VTLHQTVRDCDAAMKRAADAGATITMPAQDMFWGDRYGQVRDPFGHMWSFSTPLKK
jgi:PhnB protein